MKVILKSVVASLVVMSLAACSNNDLYDEGVVAANKTAEQQKSYENNFVKTYGAIAPNQSWDFSSAETRLGTRAGETEITTELVAGLDFGIKDEFVAYKSNGQFDSNSLTTRTISKNTALYDVLKNDLKDGKKHTGEPAVLLAPSSDFTIYPLSNQGAYTHDLYVKVGDNDPVKVYSKTWKFYGRPTVNGDVTKIDYRNWQYYVEERAVLQGIHVKAPIGTRVDVYISNINGNKNSTAGTINGQAIYLDCNVKPEGITLKDDAVIKYIGIEDVKGDDDDYNDVVLAVVGNPDVPEKITFTDDEYDVPLSVTKRYMIEDLGTTDDFDFNDVVVDVTKTTITHHKVTLANGVVVKDEEKGTDVTEKAVIKHLGGILPFVLKIGDTTLPQLGGEDTFEKDVNLEHDITGWEPANNNISITVNNTTLSFPKAGAVPMIIACDDSEAWSAERVAFDWKKFLEVK